MAFREQFIERFRFIGGHADVLGLFADGDLLREAAAALTEPFADAEVTKVAAVEARGFVLGSVVALRLGVGFVPIRNENAIHPGPEAERRTPRDWRGNENVLCVQRAALDAGDRMPLVDDWAETGNQATTARALIEDCGATYLGLSILVDQLPPDARRRLAPVFAVVHHHELRADSS